MSFIQQLFTSRDNNANAETFVGQQGRLWWDPVTNQIYSSDGSTPGGIPLAGGGGGNGSPGGSNSQVQFNNSGTFGGSSMLTFDRVTGALTAVSFVGDGAGLSNITGANVVGEVTNATYASSAVTAINAETVTANSQPNINSLGILTELSATGNVTGNYFIGNGSLLTGISSGSSNTIFNGNSNVAIDTLNGNVTITANTSQPYTWTFDTTGVLSLEGNIVGSSNTAIKTNNDNSWISQAAGNGGFSQLYWTNDIANADPYDGNGDFAWAYVDAGGFFVTSRTVEPARSYNWDFRGSDGTLITPGKFITPVGNTSARFDFRVDGAGGGSDLEFGANAPDSQYFLASVQDPAGRAAEFWLNAVDEGNLNAQIRTFDGMGTTMQWDFNGNGDLILPGNTAYIGADASQISIYSDINTETAGMTVVTNSATSIFNEAAINLTTNIADVPRQWQFDQTGNLTIPGSIILPTSGSIMTTGYNNPVVLMANADSNWAYGFSSDGSTNYYTQVKFYGDNSATRGFKILDVNSANVWLFDGQGSLTAPGNIVAEGLISATGNIVTAGYFVGNFAGNITGNIVVPGSNTQVLFNTNGNVDAVGGLTYNKDANLLTVLGTVSAHGNVQTNYFVGNGVYLSSIAGANVTGTVANATYATSAGSATTAGTVTTADQPNITSVGTLTSVTSSGNISGSYFIGNGSQLTGIVSTYNDANVSAYLAGGTDTANIITTGNIRGGNISTGNITANNLPLNANANIFSSGTSSIQVATVTATSQISSVGSVRAATIMSAVGNVTGGNLTTAGQVSATGNITSAANIRAGNISAVGSIDLGGSISAVGNITGGNLLTGANVSAFGNVTGGNIITGGIVTTVSNVIANYFVGNGAALYAIAGANVTGTVASATSATTAGTVTTAAQPNITSVGTLTSITSTGNISTTGNVTGNYYIGNGSLLTGIVSTYNDANVSAYLAGGTDTANIITTANISGAYILGNGSALTSITGANVTGTVANATYADTANASTYAFNLNGGTAGALVAQNGAGATGFITIAAANTILVSNGSSPAWTLPSSVAVGTVTANAQPNITSVGTLTSVTVTGNTTSGNLLTGGLISATGNITSAGNVSAGNLIGTHIGNLSGTTASLSGNVTGGNLLTGGIISSTGNATVANISATIGAFTTFTSAQGGNVTGTLIATSANAQFINQTNPVGYATVAGYLSVAGNVTGGNILTGGLISATGNITGGNIMGGANVNATTHTGTTASLSGNVTGGNLLTAGLISATSSTNSLNLVTRNGDANPVNSKTQIAMGFNGTTDYPQFVHTRHNAGSTLYNTIELWTSDGTQAGTFPANAVLGLTVMAGRVSVGNSIINPGNALDVGGNMYATGNITSAGNIAGGNILGTLVGNLTGTTASLSGNVTGGNVLSNGQLSTAGNITGGNLTVGGAITAIGNISASYVIGAYYTGTWATNFQALGNISTVGNVISGNVLNSGIMSSTGNITGGNLTTTGAVYSNYNTNTANTGSFMATGGNTKGGTGYLDFLVVQNTSGGATVPYKWLRTTSDGQFQIINSAYTQNIFNLTDAGNVAIPGQLFINGAQTTNGPAFSAYAAAILQTIPNDTQTKVLFQTEEYDTNNNYASSRFTPTVAGYYQLNAEVRLDGSSGTGEMMIILYKNGAEYKRGTNQRGTQIAANFWAMQVSSVAYANGVGDYFEIYVQQGSGGSVTVTAVNNTAITWFNGCMLRGA